MKHQKPTNKLTTPEERSYTSLYNLSTLKDLVNEKLDGLYDIEVLILKGHLLIERALLGSLNVLLGQKSIDDLKLRFEQTLLLFYYLDCRIERDLIESAKLYDAIKSLNILRNSIAHSLDPKDKELKNLINIHDEITARGFCYYMRETNEALDDVSKLKRLIAECVFSINLSGIKHSVDIKQNNKAL